MMIENRDEYRAVWNHVYKELHFFPNSITDKSNPKYSIPPFKINKPHVVFDISHTCDHNFNNLIKNAFINASAPSGHMYALDWQHSAFLFNPRNDDEQKSKWIENDNHFGGGYNAYFPDFYPDGDYYFFIDEDFRFGYLGHPWRKEVWIFGESLIDEFEKIYKLLGWTKIK